MASRRHTTDLSDEYRNVAIWAGIYYPLIIVFLVALCHGSLDEVEKARGKPKHPEASSSEPAHVLQTGPGLSVDDIFTLQDAQQARNESQTDRQASIYARVKSEPQPYLEATTSQYKYELKHEAQSLSSSMLESLSGPIEASGSRKHDKGTQTEIEPFHVDGKPDGVPASRCAPPSVLISSTTWQSLQFILIHRIGSLAAQVVRETSEPPHDFVVFLGFATFAVMVSSGKFAEFWEAERRACPDVLVRKRMGTVVKLNMLGVWSMLVPWYLLIKAGFW